MWRHIWELASDSVYAAPDYHLQRYRKIEQGKQFMCSILILLAKKQSRKMDLVRDIVLSMYAYTLFRR